MIDQFDMRPLPKPPVILKEEAIYWRTLLDEKGEKRCIATALRHFRSKQGLSQRGCAALLGVDRTSISAWENEARIMQPEVKRHLLMSGLIHPAYLGVRVFYAEE